SASGNLTSMTLTLSNVVVPASESLSVDLTGTGLSTTGYDSATGKLVITGTAAASAYESALRKATYLDNSPLPNGPDNDAFVLEANHPLVVGGRGVAANDSLNRIVRVTVTGTAGTSGERAAVIEVNPASPSSVEQVTAPTHGNLALNSDGSF